MELELRVKTRGGFKQTTTQGEVLQYLKIEIPEGSETVTRILKFNKNNDTVSTVIKQILKKFKGGSEADWSLYDGQLSRFLDPENTLAECKLSHLVRESEYFFNVGGRGKYK